MSLTKLSLAGNNWIIPGLWKFGKWHPVWGRENRESFFTVYVGPQSKSTHKLLMKYERQYEYVIDVIFYNKNKVSTSNFKIPKVSRLVRAFYIRRQIYTKLVNFCINTLITYRFQRHCTKSTCVLGILCITKVNYSSHCAILSVGICQCVHRYYGDICWYCTK
jgi:hypothetical protein